MRLNPEVVSAARVKVLNKIGLTQDIFVDNLNRSHVFNIADDIICYWSTTCVSLIPGETDGCCSSKRVVFQQISRCIWGSENDCTIADI